MRTKNPRDLANLYECDFLYLYRRRPRIDFASFWRSLRRINDEQMILSTVLLVLAICWIAVQVRLMGGAL